MEVLRSELALSQPLKLNDAGCHNPCSSTSIAYLEDMPQQPQQPQQPLGRVCGNVLRKNGSGSMWYKVMGGTRELMTPARHWADGVAILGGLEFTGDDGGPAGNMCVSLHVWSTFHMHYSHNLSLAR